MKECQAPGTVGAGCRLHEGICALKETWQKELDQGFTPHRLKGIANFVFGLSGCPEQRELREEIIKKSEEISARNKPS